MIILSYDAKQDFNREVILTKWRPERRTSPKVIIIYGEKLMERFFGETFAEVII